MLTTGHLALPSNNDKAIQILETLKLGWDRIGLRKEHYFYIGTFSDDLIVSLMGHKWDVDIYAGKGEDWGCQRLPWDKL